MAKQQTTTKRAGRTRKGTKTTAKAATPRQGRTRDLRLPAPGATLTRRFKGRDLRLTVLDEGFRFEGTVYRSLTAAALRATGYPAVSGPRFWKTDGHETTTPKRATRRGKDAATTDAAQPATPAETATA